jgi:hypothetical protein
MEEKTTSTGTAAEGAPSAAPGTGCFICNVALPIMEHFWSGATSDHFRNSRIEFLKGIRSLLDQRIEHLSRRPSPRTGTHVTVE